MSDPSKLGGRAHRDGLTIGTRTRWGTALRLADGTIVHGAGGYPAVRGALARLLAGIETEERAAALLRGENRKPLTVDLRALAGALALVAALLFTAPLIVALVAHALIDVSVEWTDLVLRLTLVGFVVRSLLCNPTHRRYHGAEHQTVACLEAGLPLTTPNVAAQSRIHPRCGTNLFVFIALASSAALFPLHGLNPWVHLAIQAPAGALAVALSFMGLVRVARYRLARPLLWPGMVAQYATTARPTDEHIAVAITAHAALTTHVAEVETAPATPGERICVGVCAADGCDGPVMYSPAAGCASCPCGATDIPRAFFNAARTAG